MGSHKRRACRPRPRRRGGQAPPARRQGAVLGRDPPLPRDAAEEVRGVGPVPGASARGRGPRRRLRGEAQGRPVGVHRLLLRGIGADRSGEKDRRGLDRPAEADRRERDGEAAPMDIERMAKALRLGNLRRGFRAIIDEAVRGEVGAGDDQPGLRESAGAVRRRNARHGDGQQGHGDRDNRRVLPSEADQEMDGGQRNRHGLETGCSFPEE